MSRKSKLIDIAQGRHVIHEPGMLIANFTKPMIANNYVRELGIVGNAVIAEHINEHDKAIDYTNIYINI